MFSAAHGQKAKQKTSFGVTLLMRLSRQIFDAFLVSFTSHFASHYLHPLEVSSVNHEGLDQSRSIWKV